MTDLSPKAWYRDPELLLSALPILMAVMPASWRAYLMAHQELFYPLGAALSARYGMRFTGLFQSAKIAKASIVAPMVALPANEPAMEDPADSVAIPPALNEQVEDAS